MAASLGLLSVYLACVVAALVYFWLHRRYTYWARRGVPHLKPVWLRGNLSTVGRTTSLREPFRELYAKYRGEALFGGFYLSLRTAAVLFDLDLIKQVLIKDFNNFAHRGNYYNEQDDPLSAHLFNLDGPQWQNMRKKLTPTFTSLKMGLMLPTVVEIANRFANVLQQELNATRATAGGHEAVLDLKEFLARFTTDVIGSCAFGLDCNSLKDPNAEFRVMGRRTFSERRHSVLVFAFLQAFPQLARRLHMKVMRDEFSEFYTRVVRQTIRYREQQQIKRNDFLNLLMELRAKDDEMPGLTFEQIAAQSFVFFLAGFETSSSTMGFALYELALHEQVQQKARDEVEAAYKKHGSLNYAALKDLKYIQQLLYETMRHYSIATILIRKAINDYPVPGTAHIIEAGTAVIIPVDCIHHDADIYPNPEVFDPERFTTAAMEARHSMTWLPFGAGPRNCIGLRFGEMQSIIGLAVLLKHFKFTPAKETPIPLEIDKKNFLLSSKGGIVLNVQPLN